MKNIHLLCLCLAVLFGNSLSASAQSDLTQRIERYLFSSYASNKAALRENERTTRILEEHLDKYLVKLDKSQRDQIKEQEKEVKAYLQQIQKIRDVEQLKKVVEESRVKSFALMDKFVNSGLSMPRDVLECKKLIIIKLAEFELLQNKQEKLVALLKDDYSREEFVQTVISKAGAEEVQDVKAFAYSVEIEVYKFKM